LDLLFLLACLCRLAREIGFHDSALQPFHALKTIHTHSFYQRPPVGDMLDHDYHYEVGSIYSQLFTNSIDGTVFFHTLYLSAFKKNSFLELIDFKTAWI